MMEVRVIVSLLLGQEYVLPPRTDRHVASCSLIITSWRATKENPPEIPH